MLLCTYRKQLVLFAAVLLCLTIAFPSLLFPAVKAGIRTSSDEPLEGQRFLLEVSPGVLWMLRGNHTMERITATNLGAGPAVQEMPAISYWRYVWAACMVKTSFSAYKVNWYYWSWDHWQTPELDKNYVGDCHFYVEYGAEYYGDYGGYVAIPEQKTIKDQWKKAMAFNTGPDDLSKAYYWVVNPTEWDCSDPALPPGVREDTCGGLDATAFLPCDASGNYNGATGVFTTTIGSTGADRWSCGVRMEILTKMGADLSVLSPKPGVSHTITPKTTPAQIIGQPYELRIDMKAFGVKSPANPKQSSWARTYWWLEGNGWQAQANTGMWVDEADPYYQQHIWSGPYIAGHEADNCRSGYGCNGGVQWYVRNTWNNWQEPNPDLYRWPPSVPSALFPPSSMSVKYVKSDKTGVLYDFGMEINYVHKGISFITGDDITFSGNPATVRVTHPGRSVVWDLDLWGTYPEVTYY